MGQNRPKTGQKPVSEWGPFSESTKLTILKRNLGFSAICSKRGSKSGSSFGPKMVKTRKKPVFDLFLTLYFRILHFFKCREESRKLVSKSGFACSNPLWEIGVPPKPLFRFPVRMYDLQNRVIFWTFWGTPFLRFCQF